MIEASLVTVCNLDATLTEFLMPKYNLCTDTQNELESMLKNKQILGYSIDSSFDIQIPNLVPLTPHRVNFYWNGYKIVYPAWCGCAPRIFAKNEFIGQVENIGVLDISQSDEILGDKPYQTDTESNYLVGLALGSHPNVRKYSNVYTLVTQTETIVEPFLTNPKQLWVTLLGKA